MHAWHLAVFLLVGCRAAGPPIPQNRAAEARAARLELDSMLAEGRTAHLDTDPEKLAAGLADTLLSIDEGAVSFQPKDSVRAMFGRYFAGASYRAWEDIRPPVVQIADDNSLAWVARVVCVDREEPVAGGTRRRRTFVSAYSATFVRRAGRWTMTTVTSTFLPSPPPGCPSSGQEAPR